MDIIFGSEGVAAADFERQAEINREIGLDRAIQDFDASQVVGAGAGERVGKTSREEMEKENPVILDEKREV